MKLTKNSAAPVTTSVWLLRCARRVGFASPRLDDNRARRAYVQALLAGQTALEKGLSQVMAVFQEDILGSGGPGLDLIRRASIATGRRPAILERDTAHWADVTRRFRDGVPMGTDGWAVPSAHDLVTAAKMLSQRILPGYRQFLKMEHT